MFKFLALGVLAAPVLAAEGATDTSTSTVISALVLALILSGIFYACFFILRPHFNQIYQPRSYLSKPSYRNTEALPKSFLGWVAQFIRTPDSEILRGNGLDAYMFVSFLNMMLWIFVPIWIISWAVLLPLYGARLPSQAGSEKQPFPYTGFNRFIFSHIIAMRDPLVDPSYHNQQDRMSGVLVLNYIMVAWVLVNLYWRMKHFVQLRKEFLTSPRHASSEQARTMLITGVPDEFLSETKIRQLYAPLSGGIERVWINRNIKELPKLVEERDKLNSKLEGAVVKVIRTADKAVRKGKADAAPVSTGEVPSIDVADRYVAEKDRPSHRLGKIPCVGEKVDTINYSRTEISRLNREIDTFRKRIDEDYKEYPPLSSAFVLFNSQSDAYAAAHSKELHADLPQSRRYNEVHPDDIVWDNLNMNPTERKARSGAFWALTWATVIFWCIPVAVVGIISNIDYIASNVPFLKWITSIPDIPKGIIKAVLPTALLAVLTMLLPPWLRMHSKQSGEPTKTGIELSLMTRFFLFQIIQNFLFLTIVSGNMSQGLQFAEKLSDPAGFISTIAMGIPTASTFFLSYVALMGLSGIAMGFLQPVPLILYYVKVNLLGSTPRALWHIRNDMGAPAWGVLFPSTMLVVVIAFGYMVLAPIINGWATVTIFAFYMLYRYMFLYVFDCKPANETAGMFFPKAVNFTLAGLYLAEFVVALMYFFNTGSNKTFVAYGVLTIVLIVLVIAFHVYLRIAFYSKLNKLAISDTPSASKPEANGAYGSGLDQAYPQQQQQVAYSQKPGYIKPEHAAQSDKNAVIASSQPGAYYVNRNGQVVPTQTSLNIEEKPHVPLKGASAAAGASDEDSAENLFKHPARKSGQMTLWYPNDKLGIGRSQTAADDKAGLSSTVEHATITEKGAIEENATSPPGENIPDY
ncbi:hypothetical protein MCUN1_000364 [Malassezia cuniculi]|uniref:DUF221-domain-containing protein n=1 Tax=Malassezia cuniculi TaxID=948313 RepID=A0AAF0ES73_9BASI|nr:hypothetical protein MCUN1_000364 [Malassezia cuniculi]